MDDNELLQEISSAVHGLNGVTNMIQERTEAAIFAMNRWLGHAIFVLEQCERRVQEVKGGDEKNIEKYKREAEWLDGQLQNIRMYFRREQELRNERQAMRRKLWNVLQEGEK